MGNVQHARPAMFDRASQRRRSMLAKINIGRQQIGMAEDDYRQMLFDVTGRMSLKDCSDGHLELVIKRLMSKGFRPLPARGGLKSPAQQLKARALWTSLHLLGIVRNGSDAALEAFAKRQLKCDHLSWTKTADGYRVIEALKDMAVRGGWVQVDHRNRPLGVLGLRDSLCNAILARLKEVGVVPIDWSMDIAAMRLCGIETRLPTPYSTEDYDRLAKALSQKLHHALGTSL